MWTCRSLYHLTSSFAAVIITIATRERCLTRNTNMGHNDLLTQAACGRFYDGVGLKLDNFWTDSRL